MVNDGAAAPGLAQRLSVIQDIFAAAEAKAEPVTAAQHAALLAELYSIAAFIDTTRRDIAVIGVDDIVGRHVPAATDELDAVIMHTAEATGIILDECEKLEALVEASALRQAVNANTARIYEACSFQDITGQRVAKVVHTLKMIEAKIGEIFRVFGDGPVAAAKPAHSAVLLNGPQRSGDAMAQNEVDALLASFE